jgi:hypothetical protein
MDVAKVILATASPVGMYFTSGSAPKFPINVTLLSIATPKNSLFLTIIVI